MPPPRSLTHRLLSAIFARLARPLLRAELLVADAARFGICHYNDIERLATAWLSETRTPITTILDIGANNGSTALELTQRFPTARIFSFEPHPTTFAQLTRATAGNPRIHTTNSAVGATPGTLPMSVYTESRVNTLKPSFHEAGRFESTTSIDVPVTTVDIFCAQHNIPSIDILKIDTEGFDLHVLQGATGILQRGTVRFIYVECNDLQVAPTDPGTGLLTIDNFLRPFGYRYIATYNDYNNLNDRLFQSSNALFALPPQGR
jgi:FkbM family methyltransferase